MPFGVFFAALFLIAASAWCAIGPAAAGSYMDPLLVRGGAALAVLSVAAALLTRRVWARVAGIVCCVGLAAVVVTAAAGGVTGMLVLCGSIVAAVLLIVPATGKSPVDDTRPARRGGLLLGAGAAGLLLAGTGVLLGGGAPDGRGARDSALPAASLAKRIYWSDFGKGLEKARQADKPMLVAFVTNWCGYCRKMDRTTWKDPSVVRETSGVVTVRVDADETRERGGFSGAELAARYGVSGYPAMLLIDTQGRVLARTGGYQTAAQLLGWLDDALRRDGAGRL
ncbi:MAG: thioredoxin family protein [bacterium]|nr:thioredoxin family protein [bacterium]